MEKKLETIQALKLEKVKSKKKVVLEAQRNKNKVQFASLLDLCHLQNAELEPKIQKKKGRVVLRGDIVKDDSGANAVFLPNKAKGCAGPGAPRTIGVVTPTLERSFLHYSNFFYID